MFAGTWEPKIRYDVLSYLARVSWDAMRPLFLRARSSTRVLLSHDLGLDPAMQSIRLLLACGSTAHAMLMCASSRVSAPRAAAVRMDFGDSFYAGFDAWAAEYPQEDRDAYPELFKLPKDCYEVILEKPLGIAFEENEDGGVVVDYLVEGSNAEKDGTIKPGDVLLATTAAMSIGPKFERKLIPSRYLDFDTIMGAIGSNAPKFHKKRLNDVILQACARCHPTASSCIQLHSAAFSCIQLHPAALELHYSCIQLYTAPAYSCLHPPASNLLPPPSCLRLPAVCAPRCAVRQRRRPVRGRRARRQRLRQEPRVPARLALALEPRLRPLRAGRRGPGGGRKAGLAGGGADVDVRENLF
jgi:hypothetical protein